MIKPLFGNIRNVLVEKLKVASFDVYIAVAWITDKKYEEILLNLLERGISITIITVNDDTNQSGDIDWKKLVDNGAQVYWDNHHHKFCVIDRKLVLTGSFNWTYMASNRVNRENLLIIEDEKELIEQFSQEFMKLKSSASPLQKEPEKIIQKVFIEKEVEKIVKETITSLSKYKAYKTSKNKLLCGKCSSDLSSVFDKE
jgi:phosphatidylserine/phosphatidylglycerophosphate/cardiolipin synthase-like enzyme